MRYVLCFAVWTRSDTLMTAANLWGKDEDNHFGFARECRRVQLSASQLPRPAPSHPVARLRLWLTEGDIDGFIALDTELMRCEAFGSVLALAANRCRGLLSLCISDAAKQMLLNNAGFIPHLIDGLMLDPEHPRKDTVETIKTVVQRDFAECVQQISLFPAGCEALRANEGIMHALLTLKDKAWSEEAKVCAEGALMALIPPKHHEVDIDALHIMMSCECTSVLCMIGD